MNYTSSRGELNILLDGNHRKRLSINLVQLLVALIWQEWEQEEHPYLTDSRTVFDMVRRNKMVAQTHLLRLEDVQALLRDMEHCWIGFCYRDANIVADKFMLI